MGRMFASGPGSQSAFRTSQTPESDGNRLNRGFPIRCRVQPIPHLLFAYLPTHLTAGSALRPTCLESVSWAADGRALFVSGFASKGAPLLRVRLDGNVEFLHKASKYLESPVASPDRRYIAFAENTADSNVFAIDNLR